MIDQSEFITLSTLSNATEFNTERTHFSAQKRIDSILKTSFDFILSLAGVILLSPIMLALAVIVKVDSRGPIIHRRRVMGQGGSQFDAFKFRTMHINGEQILDAYPDLKLQLERDHKLEIDPRITNCGKWMRKLSLDELPQLFNVVLGQMSLVGPRMISPKEVSRYGEFARELFTVKPGITGLWQVSGRSNLNPSDRVRLDLQFVRTRNILLDIKLLLKTLPAVLFGRGAY
jgi:lipopolysaccharide/colanic/teichoic acid biosynthesis glycosyltransferase